MILRRPRLLFVLALGFLTAACTPKEDPYEKEPPRMPRPAGPKLQAAPVDPAAQALPVPQGSLPPVADAQRDRAGAATLDRSCITKMRAKDFKGAAGKCIAALQADPYAVDPTANLATCYAALGKKEWALYMLKRLKSLRALDASAAGAKLAATQSDPNWSKYLQDDGYQAAVAQ